MQLEPDTKPPLRSIPDADILEEVRVQLQELLDRKFINIVSQTVTDIGTTNLIELNILTEGHPITSQVLHCSLEDCEFVDHEIRQLEEVGIISRSMSDWASPILVLPKEEDHADISSSNTSGSSKNSKFNLRLCINYRKLNSQIQTACQIKADGSMGKVISNYPLPAINSLLVHFNDCKFFSTIDLRSSYYHIHLTKEAAEKTAIVMDKGKWIFHSLPFGINIGPSAFSYVLGKVLAQCTEFVLNYLDDIKIFSQDMAG